MAKFLSNRQKNLKIGISSFTENQTVIEVTGKVGIGTTVASKSLDVLGDVKFQGGIYDVNDSSGTYNQVPVADGTGSWSWQANAGGTAAGINGITVREEGFIVGTAGSITNINFAGNNITATSSVGLNITTVNVTVSDTPTFDSLVVSGISTFVGLGTFNSDLYVNGNLYVQNDLVFDEFTARNGNITGILTAGSVSIGATQVISSSRELQNIASLDATTTATIEAAIANAPNTFTDLQVTGISTFVNGPVFVGSGTSTGTTDQKLQVTGGAYVSGNLGIGIINPQTKLEIGGVLGFGANNNVRIGDNTTGANLTSGNDNIFMGVGAGKNTTSGLYNNFLGYESGYSNIDGISNIFLGRDAGYYNTNGSYNNFFNSFAGQYNTTGSNNNLLGPYAGQYNTVGSYNNFLGSYAGQFNTTGNYDTFLGHFSGAYNTTGSNNTYIGAHSGISQAASNKLIFGSGYNNSNLFDAPDPNKDIQFSVGLRTDSNPSKYWLVGNENFNIGIGTTNPTSKLTVGGDGYFTGVVTASNFYVGNSVVGAGGSFENLYVSGISTFIGNITGSNASFSGNVTIGGTLTYEDVTNVDAIGLVTARTGVRVLSGGLDVVGGSTLDSLNVTGVSTFVGLGTFNGDLYVGGDLYVKDDLIFDEFTARNANVTGILTAGSVSIGLTQVISSSRELQNIVSLDATTTATIEAAISNAPNTFTDLQVTGISTLGVTTVTDLTAQSINSSGIVTGNSFRPSSGYIQAADGTNSFYIYSGTGNVAFQGTIGASSINNASGYQAIDFSISASPDVIVPNNLDVLGFVTSGNSFISKSTGLLSPTPGNYSGERVRLYDFNNDAQTNYAIGVEGSHIWFGVDTNLDAQGFKWYGDTTEVMRLGASGNLTVAGITSSVGGFVGNLTGIAASATQLVTPRTFEITGDIVASQISFDGTGNVSLAATIQPNSVGLGSDTTGDYVQSISGTANEITVTGGTGEGSTPTVSFAPNPLIGGNVTIGNDLQVNNNLNVTGNITVGGTTAYIIVQDFRVTDPDITLGFTTDSYGNDASTDTTANHGGIAIASTEGNPLVQLVNVSIGETLPATYKKFMWFKAGAFAGLNTDAWLSNYAIGIGSTQFPAGTRLAAGAVQFTEQDLAVVRNINASGIVSASTGNFASSNVDTANIVTGVVTTLSGSSATYTTGNFGTGNINVGVITTLSGTTATYTTLNATTGNINTGIVTNLSGTTATYTTGNFSTGNINTGIVTSISGTNLNYTGVGTIATLSSTNATITNINSTGITTVGFLTAINVSVSGVTTSSAYYIDGTRVISSTRELQNIASLDSVTTATIEAAIANAPNTFTDLQVTGISTLGTVQVSSGIISATSGIVTYYGDGSHLTGVNAFNVIQQEVTSQVVYPTLANATGVSSVGISTTQLVFVPSSGNLGIGTTNPQTKLQINGVLGFVGNRNNVRIGDNTTGANLINATGFNGYNNIFMGVGAGNSSTGSRNNFFGYGSGGNNITGNDNNFFGLYAGQYNSKSNNNFFGYYAGRNNTGDNNNFLGYQAGAYNNQGYFNNFLGYRAGYLNDGGDGNNFIGSQAGAENKTGNYNNFFGNGSGQYNESGSYNNFFGRQTGLDNTTGSQNNFLGYRAGRYNTTGSNNTLLGSYTGISTSASNKLIFGRGFNSSNFFDSPDTTKDTQFAVGVRTDANPSKYWLVGNENFNIGIGTTNPQYKLDVGGDINFTGTFYQNNSPFVASRWTAGTGDNIYRLNGNVGVGTTNPQTKLEINGVLGFSTYKYPVSGFEYNNIRIGDNTTGPNLSVSISAASGNNIFIGRQSGYSQTFASDNTFIGRESGYYNTSGGNNNFIGRSAGYYNTLGTYNLFLGGASGYSNTTGQLNNFFGENAGFYNTTGNQNNAIGFSGGYKNSTGNNNIFFGNFTGISTSASDKVIIGRGNQNNEFDSPDTTKDTQFAVGVRTDANPSKYWLVGNENFNIGIGTTNPQTKLEIGGVLGFGYGNNVRIGNNLTGANLTPGNPISVSGTRNIFIGPGAGNSTTSGYYNNFFGHDAGYYNTTGRNNNFIGRRAGNVNTTGNYNNFFGRNSGYYNTTGVYNNFIGSDAGNFNSTGAYNNFFGALAGYNNTTGRHNSFFGSYAGAANETGSLNIFLGSYNGLSSAASQRVIIGSGNTTTYDKFDAPDTTKDTQFAVGVRTDANPSKYWIVGNENFNIGIGTTNPTEKLTVGGNILVNDTTLQGSIKATTSTTSAVGIHSALPIATYRSVEYTIQATEGSNFHATKILALHDGSSAYLTEYGTIYNNASVSGFNVDVSGGNIRLLATPASASTTNYTINFVATKI